MKILCDTHIIIWYLTADERLSAKAQSLINDENNEIFFSLGSVWEIAIKHSRKPETFSLSPQKFVDFCEEQGFVEFPLLQEHIFTLQTLSRSNNAPEHHDPFDRLLICQAKAENIMFLTHDNLIPFYNEPCVMFV